MPVTRTNSKKAKPQISRFISKARAKSCLQLVNDAYKEYGNSHVLKEITEFHLQINKDNEKFHGFIVGPDGMDQEMRTWIMDLFVKNVGEFYKEREAKYGESIGPGLDLDDKHKELFDKTSRFIIIKSGKDDRLAGYTMFRFEKEDLNRLDPNSLRKLKIPIVYCYELEIESEFQGMGLGKALVRALDKIAKETQMDRIMLTSFKGNEKANLFYNKMGFVIDESSPTLEKDGMDVDYQIMKKEVV